MASDFFRKGAVSLYNRYIRGDDGVYTRVPMDEVPPPRSDPPPKGPPPPPPERGAPERGAPERGFFNDLLEKLHLGDLDAGDLLLLFLLFYLSRQKADEELLIAIGLLLIL